MKLYMSQNYQQRIKRVLKPEKVDKKSNCHENLDENIRELLQDWHNQLQLDGRSKATRCDYLTKASIFFRKYPENPSEIGKKQVNDFLSGKSQGTISTYKATLKQFFTWYYLDHKQVSKDELPRYIEKQLKVTSYNGQDKVKKEDIPTEQEIKTLMEGCLNHRDRALIAILADKGMRISEALALNVEDVNFDKAGIYLMVPEAKKDYESYRKNRVTWSRPALKDWLEAHPRKDEDKAPLFVTLRKGGSYNEYTRLDYGGARGQLERLKKRLDVSENISMHKFRHYSTTRDRQKEHLRDSYIVKDKGWDDPSMLERYDHLTDDTVDKAHIKQMVKDGQLDKSVLEDLQNGDSEDVQELELIKCPNCQSANSPERDYCDQCNQPFNQDGIDKQEELKSLINDVIEEKGLMDKLKQEIA